MNNASSPAENATGRAGQWLAFLARMGQHGYEAIDPTIRRLETESVSMRCRTHPDAEVQVWTRAKFGQWLATFQPNNRKQFPPACAVCAQSHAAQQLDKRQAVRTQSRERVDARLAAFGHKLVTYRPVTLKDPVTKKVVPQTNDIECLACGHVRPVFVNAALQVADAKGKMVCPQCEGAFRNAPSAMASTMQAP